MLSILTNPQFCCFIKTERVLKKAQWEGEKYAVYQHFYLYQQYFQKVSSLNCSIKTIFFSEHYAQKLKKGTSSEQVPIKGPSNLEVKENNV